MLKWDLEIKMCEIHPFKTKQDLVLKSTQLRVIVYVCLKWRGGGFGSAFRMSVTQWFTISVWDGLQSGQPSGDQSEPLLWCQSVRGFLGQWMLGRAKCSDSRRPRYGENPNADSACQSSSKICHRPLVGQYNRMFWIVFLCRPKWQLYNSILASFHVRPDSVVNLQHMQNATKVNKKH